MLSLIVSLWLQTTIAEAQECVPDCRSGYMCYEAQCVSKCNPACDAGMSCTDAGECIANAAPAPEAPAPPVVEQGRVCVFRNRNVGGAAIPVGIRENGALIASFKPGTYRCWNTPAGMHHFTAKTEVEKAWDIDVPAGKTVYLRALIVIGGLVGRPDLVASTKSEMHEPKKPYQAANGT